MIFFTIVQEHVPLEHFRVGPATTMLTESAVHAKRAQTDHILVLHAQLRLILFALRAERVGRGHIHPLHA